MALVAAVDEKQPTDVHTINLNCTG